MTPLLSGSAALVWFPLTLHSVFIGTPLSGSADVDKVAQTANLLDNCKVEFNYAMKRKTNWLVPVRTPSGHRADTERTQSGHRADTERSQPERTQPERTWSGRRRAMKRKLNWLELVRTTPGGQRADI